jgi:predicted phage-related endonuclease
VSYRILIPAEKTNTPEWLAARKQGGIGASEAAAILGDTNWGTPLAGENQSRPDRQRH